MDIAETSPAPQDRDTGCGSLGTGGTLGEAGQGGFKMRLEEGQDAGDGCQHRDALPPDGLNQARGYQAAFKVQLGCVDGRNPQAHGLAEDVAQGQRVQDAQRMDQTYIAQVGLRCFFNGPDAGQHIAVGEHDPFGVARGAGGEEDLERCVGGDAGDGAGLFSGQLGEPVFKGKLGPGAHFVQKDRVAHHELWRYIGGHARGKLRGAVGVQRDGQHATEHAAVEGRDPLGAVFGPEEDAVAHADGAALKQRGKPAGEMGDLAIGGYTAAVALVTHHGDLAIEAAKVVKECGQMVSHGRSRQAAGSHFQRFRCASGRRGHGKKTMTPNRFREWAGCDSFGRCMGGAGHPR